MIVKAYVRCDFEIEYDDGREDNIDIEYTKESIESNRVRDLLDLETEESIQYISVIGCKRTN
jgi:hypothetical protein